MAPEELVARKIYFPKDANVIRSAKREGRPFGRNWQQQLVIAYRGAESFVDEDRDVRALCKNLREALLNYPLSKLANLDCFGELNKFFDEQASGAAHFRQFKYGRTKVADLCKKLPRLVDALKAIYEERKRTLSDQRTFTQFLRRIDYARIPQQLAKLTDDQLLEFFKIDRAKIAELDFEPVLKYENRWEKREKAYRELFAEKIIHSDFDEETALKFLHDYYDIRNERNQVNHANAQASKTIDDLKPMIENYLAALEKISSSKKTAATPSRNG